MSIGKRLIDLARSELNSLLDKAARVEDDDDRRSRRAEGDVGSMSDEELQAEIQRRRQAREEGERITSRGRAPAGAARPARPTGAERPFREYGAPPPRRTAAGDEAIRRAYAALEVPAGSDFEAVKRSYRRLMRKYHPDLNAGSVEKQAAATDLAQRLTEAYKTLEKQLRK
jgi:DnaJ-domain-containing protein 1